MNGDLASLLDHVAGFVRRFVVVADSELVALALWVGHTHAVDAATQTPYLSISSPEKRSGKSRLLDALELLVHCAWRAVLPSEAVVFRVIAQRSPTLLLDEADAIFGPKAKDYEGLRALLNAGFRREGSAVPRIQMPGGKLVEFETFCPKAIAGIGQLPDTISDRSIPIGMKRKRPDETVERFRRRDAKPLADELHTALQTTMASLLDELTDARPELPDELNDREQDAWEPLLAIADAAGGDWPWRARRAAVALSQSRTETTIGLRLLADAHAVFQATDRTELPTGEFIERLAALPDAPWGEWRGGKITGRILARLLEPYGIRPKHSGAFRGYRRADFADAWARYVPQSVQSVHTGSVEPKTPPDEVSSEPPKRTLPSEQKPPVQAEQDTWTHQSPRDETGGAPPGANLRLPGLDPDDVRQPE